MIDKNPGSSGGLPSRRRKGRWGTYKKDTGRSQRETEKFITRQPPRGGKDNYDNEFFF
jgi:hypothetical protein